MRSDPTPASHPAGEELCGWPVQASRSHGWRCNASFAHDHEHRLTMGGRIVARAWRYTHPAVPTSGQAER